MTDYKKKLISRRKLIGGMGKLAYVAPTLTLFSVDSNAQVGSPPCPPNDPCPEGTPGKQKSRTENRLKKKPKT